MAAAAAGQQAGPRPGAAAGAAAAQVAVITTLGCPYCKRAKDALRQAGVAYQELDLGAQPDLLSRVKAATGQRTVPQVFIDGQLVGGANELVALIEAGQLAGRLAAATRPPLPPDLQQAVSASPPAAGSQADPKQMFRPADWDEERYQRSQQAGSRMRDEQNGVPRSSLQLRGATYPRAFSASDAAAWLQQAGLATSEAAALQLLKDLQQTRQVTLLAGSLDQGTSDKLASLHFIAELLQPCFARGDPLNAQHQWWGPARPAQQVAEGLRQAILGLYDRHLSADGRAVSYRGLAADPAFADFVTATAELQKVDVASLAREERMAFFINIYNALVVHGLVAFGPYDGLIKRLQWFNRVKYLIGGMEFSCNDIEHGVLRGNAASPAHPWSLLGRPQWAPPSFAAGDPRARLAVQPVDPRIHFALVCGAKSCPPIKVYTPAALEEGLASAAAAFCEGEVEVDVAGRRVTLSKILKWYRPDFPSPDTELLRYLLPYVPAATRAALEQLLRSSAPITIAHRPYDWSTNAAE